MRILPVMAPEEAGGCTESRLVEDVAVCAIKLAESR